MYVLPPDHPWTRADDRYQRTYFYIQVARNKAPVFATPEPGEEEDEPVIDKTSHEAWGAEQRKLIQEGKRPEFDHSYVPCLFDKDGKDPIFSPQNLQLMLYLMSYRGWA
jgi:hypothetical protein